jgi:hypothetical protein
MYKDFMYLREKILDAQFVEFPFRHLYIEDFLSKEHLNLVINYKKIKLSNQESTERLINLLLTEGYDIQHFPGCTESVEEYLKWYNKKKKSSFHNDKIVEAFGMAFRLIEIDDIEIKTLIDFLNSELFHSALKNKFNLTRSTKISTGIQKYLTGYEISPHPDIRSKALTYLVNINTNKSSEFLNIHTHLLRFKSNKEYLYNYWNDNSHIDRCWVPWEWCDTFKIMNKNNSLVMFSPNNDTLHAVKLDYDHLEFQRTQLYGNLWYENKLQLQKSSFIDLP